MIERTDRRKPKVKMEAHERAAAQDARVGCLRHAVRRAAAKDRGVWTGLLWRYSLGTRLRPVSPVIDIGDIRNGLLLYNGLHRLFGDGEIAFLLVRNRIYASYTQGDSTKKIIKIYWYCGLLFGF
jgi:hypothetical protein